MFKFWKAIVAIPLKTFNPNTLSVRILELLGLSGAKGIVTGTGPELDGITSSSTCIDYAGNLITCPAGMIRRQGGRLVNLADGVMYNAGIPGYKWFDADPSGVALPVKPVELIEPSAINLFVNPLTPATQTIALSAGTYSIYMLGSGSITLSGGATKTVTSASTLTFTTTGSTTFTVSGTVTACNVVAGSVQSSIIPGTSRAKNSLNLPAINNISRQIQLKFNQPASTVQQQLITVNANGILKTLSTVFQLTISNSQASTNKSFSQNVYIVIDQTNTTLRIFTSSDGIFWNDSGVVLLDNPMTIAGLLELFKTINTPVKLYDLVTLSSSVQLITRESVYVYQTLAGRSAEKYTFVIDTGAYYTYVNGSYSIITDPNLINYIGMGVFAETFKTLAPSRKIKYRTVL